MRRTITLPFIAVILILFLGFLMGNAVAYVQSKPSPPPFIPPSSSVSASPVQGTPCLRFFNDGMLGVCYNGGLFQETFNFPRTSWDGSPLPIGSAIGLQMTRLTMYADGTKLPKPYTHAQFIYSKQGGGMFGPMIMLDDAYWVYLTQALVAQRDNKPTP